MSTAHNFKRIVVELIKEASGIINDVKTGDPDARIRLAEWMKFLMILSPEIKYHPLNRKEFEGLQDIIDELRGESMMFLEGREHFIQRISKVIHVLENGNWVWARFEGNPESLLGCITDIDREHETAVLRVGRRDLQTDIGFRIMNMSVPFLQIERIEEDSKVFGEMAWVMEQSRVCAV